MLEGTNIQLPKLRGEWAELCFMQRATQLGLILTKPWGDSAPYDFAVDHLGHFLRIQVKCTLQRREKQSYRCCLDHNGSPYTPAQIDFVAADVLPVDVWYILPLAATHSQPDILLSPHRQKSKYSPYKEAWHLLMR
jgi:hypothetical protein